MKIKRLNGRKRGLRYNSVNISLTPKELKALLKWYERGASYGISEPPPKNRRTVYSVCVE